MLEQEKTPDGESRLENLDELINAATEAAERGEGLGDFLDHAALVAESDAFDESAPVALMTLHNAKGLEFPVVFLTGLELGLFPHSRSANSEAALEEERRLCYVGMTRARKRLILTWAKFRRRFGGGDQERSTPSWFLSEVPEKLVWTWASGTRRGKWVSMPSASTCARRRGGILLPARPTTRSTTFPSSSTSAAYRSARPSRFRPRRRRRPPGLRWPPTRNRRRRRNPPECPKRRPAFRRLAAAREIGGRTTHVESGRKSSRPLSIVGFTRPERSSGVPRNPRSGR